MAAYRHLLSGDIFDHHCDGDVVEGDTSRLLFVVHLPTGAHGGDGKKMSLSFSLHNRNS